MQFVDGYSWGSVKAADVKIGSEVASSVPIDVMGDPAYPASLIPSCAERRRGHCREIRSEWRSRLTQRAVCTGVTWYRKRAELWGHARTCCRPPDVPHESQHASLCPARNHRRHSWLCIFPKPSHAARERRDPAVGHDSGTHAGGNARGRGGAITVPAAISFLAAAAKYALLESIPISHGSIT